VYRSQLLSNNAVQNGSLYQCKIKAMLKSRTNILKKEFLVNLGYINAYILVILLLTVISILYVLLKYPYFTDNE